MKWNRFIRGWVAAAVIFVAASAAIVLPFEEVVQAVPGARETPLWWIDVLGVIVLSFCFTYMYVKGYEGKDPLREGLRYGLTVGVFVASGYFIGYAFVEMTNAQLGLHILGSIAKFGVAGVGAAVGYGRGS